MNAYLLPLSCELSLCFRCFTTSASSMMPSHTPLELGPCSTSTSSLSMCRLCLVRNLSSQSLSRLLFLGLRCSRPSGATLWLCTARCLDLYITARSATGEDDNAPQIDPRLTSIVERMFER